MISIITGLSRSSTVKVWACAASLAVLASACDKVPLLAPQMSTITVSSSSSVVQANGTAEIRATVLEQSGTPVQNGTTVSFSTNLGVLSPAEARTINGTATVQFVANGQSGKALIKALSGGAASEPLELSVGAAAATRINVSADPSSVPASGGVSTITATVVDASGNSIRDVPVTFGTTAGTLSANVVNSNSNGFATTMLTTIREATVTATAGGTTSATVVVGVAVRPTVSIAVAAGSTPTEGAITTFAITAAQATGGSPIQSVVVDYDDGSSDNLGSVSGTTSVQHVYRDDGAFTPKVTALDTTGVSATASTAIYVQPLLVSISVSKTGNTATLTANVSPSGSSIASYAWTFGDGTAQTTSANAISHTYVPGAYTVRVTARTSTGHTSSATADVTIP